MPNPSLITGVIVSFLFTLMTKASALSQPTVWADYKNTLRPAKEIQREIKIRAVKIGSSHVSAKSVESKDEDHITTKIIHFQRHGQGYHNLLGDVTRAFGKDFHIDDPDPDINPFVKPEIQDSPLTHKGRQEAAAQRKSAAMLNPEVVIVSPLHRAVQTALISFADHRQNGIPFVAHEGCREQLGLLTCNKAMPISQTIADFPQVNFELCTAGEEDSLWNRNPEVREDPISEANRAYEFLTNFLMRRPEKEIAVVCHSAWLFSVCNAVIDCGGDESIESWFGTGEIRSLRISYHKQ
jgi:broad specificity phosphatase PhoE